MAPFPIHRPAQLRWVGGYCNLLLPCTREETEENRDSEVSLRAGTTPSLGPCEVPKSGLQCSGPQYSLALGNNAEESRARQQHPPWALPGVASVLTF